MDLTRQSNQTNFDKNGNASKKPTTMSMVTKKEIEKSSEPFVSRPENVTQADHLRQGRSMAVYAVQDFEPFVTKREKTAPNQPQVNQPESKPIEKQFDAEQVKSKSKKGKPKNCVSQVVDGRRVFIDHDVVQKNVTNIGMSAKEIPADDFVKSKSDTTASSSSSLKTDDGSSMEKKRENLESKSSKDKQSSSPSSNRKRKRIQQLIFEEPKKGEEPKKAEEPKNTEKPNKIQEPKKVEVPKMAGEPKKIEEPKKVEKPKKIEEWRKDEEPKQNAEQTNLYKRTNSSDFNRKSSLKTISKKPKDDNERWNLENKPTYADAYFYSLLDHSENDLLKLDETLRCKICGYRVRKERIVGRSSKLYHKC